MIVNYVIVVSQKKKELCYCYDKLPTNWDSCYFYIFCVN